MANKLSKRQENKQRLISDLKSQMRDDQYAWQDFIWDLIDEALQKRTQKELKQLLYGD